MGAAAFLPIDGEHALGEITRDGTTVHIPFLTTWADYNQRIVVSKPRSQPGPVLAPPPPSPRAS